MNEIIESIYIHQKEKNSFYIFLNKRKTAIWIHCTVITNIKETKNFRIIFSRDQNKESLLNSRYISKKYKPMDVYEILFDENSLLKLAVNAERKYLSFNNEMAKKYFETFKEGFKKLLEEGDYI